MHPDLAQHIEVFHRAQKTQAPALEGADAAQFREYLHPGN
jgi:hypothetical protein